MRSRWLLGAGLALAMLGGTLMYSYLQSLDRRVPVVVAARDLRPREQIGPGDVRIVHLHPESVLPGAVRDLAQSDGLWVIHAIFGSEQITVTRTELSLAEHCAWGLGELYRAMFVPVGFGRAAGGVLYPGDRVDLVAVTSGHGETVAYRLGTDLEVLELRDERGQPSTPGQSKSQLGGVLLAVPDYLVEPVALAVSCGHVYVALRDPRIREAHPDVTGPLEDMPQ